MKHVAEICVKRIEKSVIVSSFPKRLSKKGNLFHCRIPPISSVVKERPQTRT